MENKTKVLTIITKWSSISLAMMTLILMVVYSTAGQKELQAIAIAWLIAFTLTIGAGGLLIAKIVREPN